MINEALGFIRQEKDRPFFLYYPTTVPHLAIQVPEDRWPNSATSGRIRRIRAATVVAAPSPRAGYAAMVTHWIATSAGC